MLMLTNNRVDECTSVCQSQTSSRLTEKVDIVTIIQDGIGVDLAAAPSPQIHEMIEKLGYLISLNR